jgi:hypothetical protein
MLLFWWILFGVGGVSKEKIGRCFCWEERVHFSRTAQLQQKDVVLGFGACAISSLMVAVVLACGGPGSC